MREIKFRGYAVEEMCDGQWVYGTGIHRTVFSDEYAAETGEKGEWFIFTERGFVKVHKESIGQFTGLKDKHGREIYEGDFYKNMNGVIWKIYFDENTARCRADAINRDYTGACFLDTPDGEVIGNIYENSVLLEGTE